MSLSAWAQGHTGEFAWVSCMALCALTSCALARPASAPKKQGSDGSGSEGSGTSYTPSGSANPPAFQPGFGESQSHASVSRSSNDRPVAKTWVPAPGSACAAAPSDSLGPLAPATVRGASTSLFQRALRLAPSPPPSLSPGVTYSELLRAL